MTAPERVLVIPNIVRASYEPQGYLIVLSEVNGFEAQVDDVLLVPVFVIEIDKEVDCNLIDTVHAAAHLLDLVRFQDS